MPPRSGRCVGGLRTLGIKRGDTYLIRTPNCRELVIAFLAGAKLGAVPIMAHSLLGMRELGHILENGEPVAAIVSEQSAAPLRALRGESKRLRTLVIIGEAQADEIPFKDLLTGGETSVTADTASDEPAFIVYTSGTTGLAKGIVHAHRWIISVGHPAQLHMPLSSGDTVMHTSELSFIWGLGHGFLFPLAAGATIALMPGRPAVDTVMAAIAQFGVAVLATVPTLLRAILAAAEPAGGYRIDSLRRVYASGEALGEATYTEWTTRFKAALYEVYGVSEFQVIIANGPAAAVRPGSMGRAHPGVAVAVIDGSLVELGPNQTGSFAIRGDDPGLFLEYRKQEEKWREAHRGPWYDTGDQVYRDEDGYFWYLGRQDDLFKSRGYLISPKEIEEALLGCEGVQEAAIVGEPNTAIGNQITGDALCLAVKSIIKRRLLKASSPLWRRQREVEKDLSTA
ncbi:MAG: acyl-CoA synthetase [Candidatus Binataceae bacterium]